MALRGGLWVEERGAVDALGARLRMPLPPLEWRMILTAGGGSRLQAALGIHRAAVLLCLVYSAAAAASKALRARSAQLLACAWLPNNAREQNHK